MRSINESMLTAIRQFMSGTGVAAFFKKEFCDAIGDCQVASSLEIDKLF